MNSMCPTDLFFVFHKRRWCSVSNNTKTTQSHRNGTLNLKITIFLLSRSHSVILLALAFLPLCYVSLMTFFWLSRFNSTHTITRNKLHKTERERKSENEKRNIMLRMSVRRWWNFSFHETNERTNGKKNMVCGLFFCTAFSCLHLGVLGKNLVSRVATTRKVHLFFFFCASFLLEFFRFQLWNRAFFSEICRRFSYFSHAFRTLNARESKFIAIVG